MNSFKIFSLLHLMATAGFHRRLNHRQGLFMSFRKVDDSDKQRSG